MLSHHLRVLYLHGFASSPASSKAKFFRQKLEQSGFLVDVPDLAEGDFEHLTLSRQLRVIERCARHEPIIFMGSSMGGYLAALYAGNHPEVAKLILLAPAFGFHQLWINQVGPERLAQWRETGSLSVLHYGEQRQMPLNYQLMEDARAHPAFPDFTQPALVLHGREDAVVPVQSSIDFSRLHENVCLVTFTAGHELSNVMEAMWQETRSFLGL